MNGFRPLAVAICAISAVSVSSFARADFLNDSSLDLDLKNIYFNKDSDSTNADGDHVKDRQWVQGLGLSFKSGYFADVIGFDAAYFGALKLNDSHNNVSDILPMDSDGDLTNIGKLGVANIKAKFGNDNIGANLRAGRMLLDTPLLASSTSRATPSSFNAFYGDMHFDGLSLYSAYTNSWSMRDHSGFSDWETSNGKIDDVVVYGGAFDKSNWHLQADAGRSKDYLKRTHYAVGYTFDINQNSNLLLEAHYHTAKDDGALFRQENGHDLDAKMYQLVSYLKTGSWGFGLTYKKNEDDTMYYFWSPGMEKNRYESGYGGDHGTIPDRTSRQVSDFWAKGEKVWQAEMAYDFASMGVPGLNALVVYTTGSDAHNFNAVDKGNGPNAGQTGDEWERDVELNYAFQQPSLKGLSLTWQWATYRNSNGSRVDFGSQNTDDNRIYINYTVALL